MKIGIDIGRVIIGGNGEDTFFSDSFLETPEVEGAYEAINQILKDGHEVHLISKCGEKVEMKSLVWLASKSYVPGMLHMHRIHFVRKRHLKSPMALALELDIFIDDRQDVLDHMVEIVPHLILFTSWEQANTELELAFEMGRAFAASKG